MSNPALLVGYDSSDDAAVYRVSDEVAVIETVDFFTPIVDDPYLFGQIAAANALSDVYAMGGEPKLAMNLLCVPNCLPKEDIRAILEGGHAKAVEAGCVIAGGHTIQDNEPKYGLCVTGFVHPDRILKNVGAQPGDVLVLTKPLGSGVLTTAIKSDLISPAARDAVYAHMATLNKKAGNAVRSAKNVHAHEMALLRRFVAGVKKIPGVALYGDFDHERTAVAALNIGDMDSGEVSDILSEDYGIATRPGAHCAPRLHKALGTEEQGAVRFSFGWYNTEEEADAAVNALREIAT